MSDSSSEAASEASTSGKAKQATPCAFFQMKKCTRGSSCPNPHVHDPNFKRQPCRFFARGTCRRGAECGYSDDPKDLATNPEVDKPMDPTAVKAEADFRRWRYNIPLSITNAKPLGPAMRTLWQQAFSLVQGDAGVMQEVIILLAGEGGLLRIKELLDHPMEKLSDAQLSRFFEEQLLPFTSTITLPNVINSAILESRVMAIYNCIFGVAGQRAMRLLTAITRHLVTLQLLDADRRPSPMAVSAFECGVAAFAKTLEINTGAQVQSDLLPCVDALSTFLDENEAAHGTISLHTAKKHLRQIKQRLGLGESLPSSKKDDKISDIHPTFELAKEQPGHLSYEGPRHDNDFVHIKDIAILPTLREIQSPSNEYLPSCDPNDWHVPGLAGLLDRNFRLLREDTIGQLRDSAKAELDRLQGNTESDEYAKSLGLRKHVYENAFVADLAFDAANGLEIMLDFDPPQHLGRLSKAQRQEWWSTTKRLSHEALICLLSTEGAALFFTVSAMSKPARGSKSSLEEESQQRRKTFNPWQDPVRGHIIARLVRMEDSQLAIEQYINTAQATFSLVEFPGLLLPAFMPTLEALQRMSSTLDMPFAEYLAPSSSENEQTEVKLPGYASERGFNFDLTVLAQNGQTVNFDPAEPHAPVLEQLKLHSTLDAGQAEALLGSLARSLALIQGPPGTGKSYTGLQLIRTLLANSSKAKLGPILCVTFTNHALDQGLERLLDHGVTQVIRIGSMSKSERLTELNLREVVTKIDSTKAEKRDRWDAMKKMEKEAEEIARLLRSLTSLGQEDQIKTLLELRYPRHEAQLFGKVDSEGFETVYRKVSRLQTWLRGAMPSMNAIQNRPLDELHETDLFKMSGAERHLLYLSWLNELQEQLQEWLQRALDAYADTKKRLENIRVEHFRRVLRQADVIGITTSGLARNIELLQRLNIKVVICEEAGEILEAHLLTALLPSVEHAILIGDHQQLRPRVQNFDLSVDSHRGRHHALDISLFERLVEPDNLWSLPLPYATLDIQRRMHPLISQLIRKTIYPQLLDDASIHAYPKVVGVRPRVFWLHHEHLEDEADETRATSRTNEFECDFAAELVSHLVRQGVYQTDDIAVLTPYLGQLRSLRRKLSTRFEIVLNDRDVDDLAKDDERDSSEDPNLDSSARAAVARSTLLQALRIATVDNFQGEEAKVVIISLVRSNQRNRPGFLRTTNRINVLLSRAQHGMYILGNSNTMENVDMWNSVLQILKEGGNFGEELSLCCPRHPDTLMNVRVPEDFAEVAPEAGCRLPCEKRLDCGHACKAVCHSEMLHRAAFCTEPCTRPKPGCAHNCPFECGIRCDPLCRELVMGINVTPPDCSHIKTSLPCFQFQDPSRIHCDVPMTQIRQSCGHEIEVPCSAKVDDDEFRCPAACGATLDCGHLCKNSCARCRAKKKPGTVVTEHGQCTQVCDRNYATCSHRCQAVCHSTEACPPCKAKCEVRCGHSACGKKCYEPCAPCAKAHCHSSCPHAACSMPCAAPCDWLPCSKRCTTQLSCGHQCPSVCGEACPDVRFCQICASPQILEQQADMVMFETYGQIDLDADPCIFTSCGHIFTRSSMDGIMDMSKHYKMSEDGEECLEPRASAEPFSATDLKVCPTCRGSLRDLARYGRIVRRAALDESAKRLTLWANATYHDLRSQLLKQQEGLLGSLEVISKPSQHLRLIGTIEAQLTTIRHSKKSTRYQALFKLRKDIVKFEHSLRRDEQPYQRVHDLVETVRRQKRNGKIEAFELDSSELQMREHLLALSLRIRCDVVLLSDLLAVHAQTPESRFKGRLEPEFGAHRGQCDLLINAASESANHRQEAEGCVLWAKLAAMECGALRLLPEEIVPDALQRADQLNEAANKILDTAEVVCGRLPDSTADILNEAAETRRMLEQGHSFSEWRMIVTAMQAEFRSTGHWYRCVNGHPFTVGECGMPMQLARCPSCGEGIGGQNHRAVDGVAAATDIEEQFGGMVIDV